MSEASMRLRTIHVGLDRIHVNCSILLISDKTLCKHVTKHLTVAVRDPA
jgi:hypothetical protein